MKEKLEQLQEQLKAVRAKMREMLMVEQRLVGAVQVLEELVKKEAPDVGGT